MEWVQAPKEFPTRSTATVDGYLRDEGLLPDGAQVYVWPEDAGSPGSTVYSELASDDTVETLYTATQTRSAVPEPSHLQRNIQLFAGRRYDPDEMYDRVVSLPDTYGAGTPTAVGELHEGGDLPGIDVELSWPASVFQDRVESNLPLGRGVILRMIRGGMRKWTKRANRMLSDDGAFMVRVDDFETHDVDRWLELGSGSSTQPAEIEDPTHFVGFHLDAPYGFEDVYRLDETSTGHSYFVGERPVRD